MHEGLAGLGQATGKIGPHHCARHVKQKLRQAVRGQAGDVAEDDREGDGGQQRLDQIPHRPEDGLLVDRDEIPPHEEHHQVAVTPQFAQAQVEQAALGLDDHGPVFVLSDGGLFQISCHEEEFRLNLSFDYAARTAAPLRTKYFLAERSEDVLFIRTQSKRATISDSPD